MRARLAVGTQCGTSPGTSMQHGGLTAGLDTLRNEHEYVPKEIRFHSYGPNDSSKSRPCQEAFKG